MKAGDRPHQITIKKLANLRNEGGAEKGDEAIVCTSWAAVEPISGREYFSQQMVGSDVSHRIRILYPHVAVTPKMWVEWSGRKFDIQAVLNIEERNKELHLMCKERQNG